MDSSTGPREVDLYVRKSKLVRGYRQELSTDAQEEQGRRWAAREGYTVRKVWKDIASGFKDVERADFDRALAALANGEVPALWAYAIDRFSRKGAADLLQVIGKARVVFDMDGLDSNEARDRRWIINRAEEAREYSENLSRRVKDTKDRQRDAGRWVAARPPWGYVVSRDRVLSPDETPAAPGMPSRADVVREMFRRVAVEGASTRDLVRWLDGAGVPSPGGARWQYSAVHGMLKHPAYAGWQVQVTDKGRRAIHRDASGKRVRLRDAENNPVPGLVTDAMQRDALAAFQGLKVGRPVPANDGKRNTRAKHLVTGLARCGGCGRSMPFQGRSYACQATLGGRSCGARASVRADKLEEYVFRAWVARLTNAEPGDPLLHVVSQRWTALVKPEETEEEAAARASLRAAEKDLERLLQDRQSGVYDGPARRYFGPMLQEATDAVEAAKAELSRWESSPSLDLPFLSGDDATIYEAWNAAELPMKRDLLRLAINCVTVVKAPRQGIRFNGDERVRIEWADHDTADA
ncbi:DNA invertase Pin-like site-specific DNA recombinase [Spinactinospora alkalitolerans]|uniref:DNA invertase Pin-like site-specific DNA recombinase n=1 Tax=Spinactinospora alkalitolerans TaxID=687207 RepID=A0A852TS54_9ACTN|nr:recombinase family protein [Spinactinospora alkalitolerans]NYE44994.1 DNA invertase Pin-like site-specific DNA recombinase [Spinactinospora alkalitolerans]